MNKKLLIGILLILYSTWGNSQVIDGNTLDSEGSPLPGVNIVIAGTTTGTSSDINGNFSINYQGGYPIRLSFSYVGFQPDTLLLTAFPKEKLSIKLNTSLELEGVEITAKKQTTNFSFMESINTEIISRGELEKAACCNLSESFETNASVDVVLSDAVSGARKIQMLGLDGSYSQMMYENIPMLRGLNSSFGLTFIPGTWVNSMQVTKGPGSVVNGYESMTGQINIEFHKPDEAERIFINGYVNAMGRLEKNIHVSQRLSEKWSTMIFAHGNILNQKNDLNGNSFLDTPTGNQLSGLNRWKYKSDNVIGQFGVRYFIDQRQAGQTGFRYSEHFGSNQFYGIGRDVEQIEGFGKAGFILPKNRFQSIGIVGVVRNHQNSSYFGLRNYEGEQNTGYLNVIFQNGISENSLHSYKAGASFLYDEFQETFLDSSFSRIERVPGIFSEYTYSDSMFLSVVAGLRTDFHNMFGTQLTPRLHVKYHISPLSVIRLSAGRGFRTANVFAENSSALASSRNVMVIGSPDAEISWNYGASFTHSFMIKNKDASLNIDFYHNRFVNQIVVDMENPRELLFYNLEGSSYANSFQVDFSTEIMTRLNFKTAYKRYDVMTTYRGELLRRPFVFRDRALVNLAYETKFEKWAFDITLNGYGISRIPDTSSNAELNRRETRSEEYMVVHAQITRRFKHFEVYLGGENLNNFIQKNPIISPENPFGEEFDASMVWGPVFGRMIYAGFRILIN
jgi:outer membrane receptor for ferrienterochelin and colicins